MDYPVKHQIASEHIQKPARNSSIELLRIIAACAVVVLHYNGVGKGLISSSGLSHVVLSVLECSCTCAVDLFIMISGYFLCTSQKRTIDKPIYLLLLLWIINIATYITKCFIGGGDISIVTILHLVIPPHNYFVILYITLYIVSPFINIILNKLSDRGRTIMVLWLFLLFSVYPTLMDGYQLVMHNEYMGINPVGAWGQQHGYTIVGFSLCYILGAWLRLNKFSERLLKKRKTVFLIAFCVLGVYAWYCIEEYVIFHESRRLIEYNALSYSNPLILALALFSLTFFSNLRFQSKIVNSVSKATFVCYIFHLCLIPYLQIETYASTGGVKLFIHLLISVLAIYMVSWVIWKLLDCLLKPVISKLKNIVVFNTYEK